MERYGKIKEFVQNTLGCGCPEEVFREIDIRESVPGEEAHTRIAVGGRLLIYIYRGDDPEQVERLLPGLLAKGIRERDDLSFNRLRVVIASEQKGPVGSVAMKIFRDFVPDDPKVHIHFTTPKEIMFN